MVRKVKKTLNIKCKGSDVVELDQLLEYQGNLKTLTDENYKKLRVELERWFIQPVSIWIKPDGSKYIMDGHQRVFVLKKMKAEGWDIPPIPVCEAYAKTEKEAAEIIFSNISQFGIATMDSVIEFAEDHGIDIEEVKINYTLPNIIFEPIEVEGSEPKERELSELDTEHECPSCGYKW